jgi:hypothetical protein
MSAVPHPQRRPEPTELETVVNWRLIRGASAVAVLLLVVPLTVALLLGPAPRPKPAPAVPPVALAPQVPHFVLPVRTLPPPAAAPRREAPAVKELLPPPAAPARRAPAPEPPPVAAPSPAPGAAAPPPAPEKPAGFRRRDRVSDYYLLEQLAKAPEVDLEAVKGTVAKLQLAAGKARAKPAPRDQKAGDAAPPVEPLPDLLAQRPDLSGLPFRLGADCRAPAQAAKTIQAVSTQLGRFVRRPRPSAASPSRARDDNMGQLLMKLVRQHKEWQSEAAAPTVVQMLQPEATPTRLETVKWLAEVRGPRAGAALANFAVFDPAPEVREGAVAVLHKRPRAEYRGALLRALRHPWPPAADHAAEALVELRDVSAVPELAALLDQPDPAAPVRKEGKWVVAELVRVNHLRNCFLCHAPSVDTRDLAQGSVPTPGQPLPPGYSAGRGKDPFVRADVTYLRQDFSLMQRVDKPDKWPTWQRFDFLVRTRELTPQEVAALDKDSAHPRPPTYPQREAVLFALRELTGEDLGKGSAEWHRFLLGPWLEHAL